MEAGWRLLCFVRTSVILICITVWYTFEKNEEYYQNKVTHLQRHFHSRPEYSAFSLQSFDNLRAFSMKVALGIGNYALESYDLVVTQADHCSELRMPKWPMINYQNNLYWIRYIHLLTSTFYVDEFIVFLITRLKRKSIWVQTNASFLHFQLKWDFLKWQNCLTKALCYNWRMNAEDFRHYYGTIITFSRVSSSVKITKQGFV